MTPSARCLLTRKTLSLGTLRSRHLKWANMAAQTAWRTLINQIDVTHHSAKFLFELFQENEPSHAIKNTLNILNACDDVLFFMPHDRYDTAQVLMCTMPNSKFHRHSRRRAHLISPDAPSHHLWQIIATVRHQKSALIFICDEHDQKKASMFEMMSFLHCLDATQWKHVIVFCHNPNTPFIQELQHVYGIQTQYIHILSHSDCFFNTFSYLTSLPAMLHGFDVQSFRQAAAQIAASMLDERSFQDVHTNLTPLIALMRQSKQTQCHMVIPSFDAPLFSVAKWWQNAWSHLLHTSQHSSHSLTAPPLAHITSIHQTPPRFQHSWYVYLNTQHDVHHILSQTALNSLNTYAQFSLHDISQAYLKRHIDSIKAHKHAVARQLTIPFFNAETIGALLMNLTLETMFMMQFFNISKDHINRSNASSWLELKNFFDIKN